MVQICIILYGTNQPYKIIHIFLIIVLSYQLSACELFEYPDHINKLIKAWRKKVKY